MCPNLGHATLVSRTLSFWMTVLIFLKATIFVFLNTNGIELRNLTEFHKNYGIGRNFDICMNDMEILFSKANPFTDLIYSFQVPCSKKWSDVFSRDIVHHLSSMVQEMLPALIKVLRASIGIGH